MFQCMKSGCPWACGTRRNVSCGEDLLKRALASVLWLVLLGSILAGALTLMQETRAATTPARITFNPHAALGSADSG